MEQDNEHEDTVTRSEFEQLRARLRNVESRLTNQGVTISDDKGNTKTLTLKDDSVEVS